jgi:hypothetical protein
MAYYGSGTNIEQGAAGFGQVPPVHAYADGILGGRPGEAMPGPLQAWREGVFSSLEGGLGQLDEKQKRMLMWGIGGAVVLGAVALVAMKKGRRTI